MKYYQLYLYYFFTVVLPPASVAGITGGSLNFSAAATWACWLKSSICKWKEKKKLYILLNKHVIIIKITNIITYQSAKVFVHIIYLVNKLQNQYSVIIYSIVNQKYLLLN